MNNIQQRLNYLRQNMLEQNIQACIIPSSDPHASEYVAEHWKARTFFSGFTGSAGTLVVAKNKAGLWTDSRYFLQAEKELLNSGIELFKMGEANVPTYEDWICKNLSKGDNVLAEEFLFSINEIQSLYKKLSTHSINLETEASLIASSWENRPVQPTSPIFIHDDKFSGLSTTDKLNLVRHKLKEQHADLLVLNTLDEIAWAFNIRGNDIEYNPLAVSYAVIEQSKAILFIDLKKIDNSIQNNLSANGIELMKYSDITSYLQKIRNKQVWIDSNKMNYALYKIIAENNRLILNSSPVIFFKSIKNKIEISGIKQAMIKDGIALCQFFIWLDDSLRNGENITEMLIGEKLKSYRAKQADFFGESFAPIVGYKEHGAIVHYSANEETNVPISSEGMLLIDSGAQFLHGTTDITRTVSLGNPTEQEQTDFTLVLKGHIALAEAIFPEGTCGYQLDALARQFLWKKGLNYGHGTGHGVGCFLCVHEGPQGIRPDANKTALQEGMVISNEPGLYRTNEYGIRIENLILVEECKKIGQDKFFSFETLTLFPFDKKLIKVPLLTENEINWINSYHQKVFDNLSPLLTEVEKTWLAAKCEAI